MPLKDHLNTTWLPVLALAAVGQFFLALPGHNATLWTGLLFFGLSLWSLKLIPFPGREGTFGPRTEQLLFGSILLLGFFLRIYRIDSIPAGLHTDQGLIAKCALRILHDGWRPFGEVFDYEVPELLLIYPLAGWFGLFGPSELSFHLFFVILSLAAFPLVYWTLRQWAGPRVALLSLFLLSVMRWNWIETRNGYPSIQVPFYLFGALALWTHWRKGGKVWAFIGSAFFVGIGVYSYQAFKVVPFLMVLYALYEVLRSKRTGRSFNTSFIWYFLVVLTVAAPFLNLMWQEKTFGHREADIFLGSKVLEQKSLRPVWDVWTGTALMFNRAGDMNPRHNIPGHRMLDDVTAGLFVLGLGLAWRRRKDPEGFYPLVGFLVMCLPGILSTDIAHSNRLVALTPFVAYFAGLAGVALFDEAGQGPLFVKQLRLPWAVLLLALLTTQDFTTYFDQQGNDPQCRSAFGVEQNTIGRMVSDQSKRFPGKFEYYLDLFYYGNHTVYFLSYPSRKDMKPFDLWDWAKASPQTDKDALIILENGRSGVWDFLKTLYPKGAGSRIPGEDGHTLLYQFSIPRSELAQRLPWSRGLKGLYINSSEWNAAPVTTRVDPVLNLSSKLDFPFRDYPPFRVRWTGSLEVKAGGDYLFQVLTTDQAQLWLDGKPVPLEKPFALKAGPHKLRLDFEKDSGDAMALDLIWKEPGDAKWEVIPAGEFGILSR